MFLEPLKEIRWAYQLHYYVCFRTRWRHEAFSNLERQVSISHVIDEICKNHDYHLLRHKVYPDHVRCLVSLRPDHKISAVVNRIKSVSSREFCSEYGMKGLWATGYLARSVGCVQIKAVRQYLAEQAEHHGYSRRILPPVFRYRSDSRTVLRAAHVAFDLNYHMVLATHYRRSVFGSKPGKELVSYWLRVAEKHELAIDQVSVVPDHVHLLLRTKPRMSIQECALSLMNNGQDFMCKSYSEDLIAAKVDSLWQPSAYSGTCGEVTTAMVKSFLSSA